MIQVTLYTRKGCLLCDEVKEELNKLQAEVPHDLVEVDIDQDPALQAQYGESVPVVKTGAYLMKAPITPIDLKITLGATARSEEHNRIIDENIRQVPPTPWTGADSFSYWLSKHYLAALNIFVGFYMGLPILAPVLMKLNITGPASVIYRIYGFACHQLAFRSMFLFGRQFFYPREIAGEAGLLTYEQATGLQTWDLWTARQYVGDSLLGFKVALCERDIAIYAAILAFGLLFGLGRWLKTREKPTPTSSGKPVKVLPSIPWYIWIVLALVPIGVDGVSQLISQPPLSLIPLRESTPFLRILTGAMFGFFTAWFGYPMVEESMAETRQYMEEKLRRLEQAKA